MMTAPRKYKEPLDVVIEIRTQRVADAIQDVSRLEAELEEAKATLAAARSSLAEAEAEL